MISTATMGEHRADAVATSSIAWGTHHQPLIARIAILASICPAYRVSEFTLPERCGEMGVMRQHRRLRVQVQ